MLHRVLSELRYRLRAVFRRDRMEGELDAELRFHMEKEAEKHVAAGLPHDEAVRRARLAFGGVERIKDDTRDSRGLVFFDTMAQDLRYAIRGLRARKAFTLGVVLTLGLGIGANATMFGIVDRLLFRAPYGLRDQATAHRVYMRSLDTNEERIDRNYSFARFLDVGRLTRSFAEVAAFQTLTIAVGEGEDTKEMRVTVASAGYFRFFDVQPALGRFFAAEDDSIPTGAPVAVLGFDYWQARFGGRSDILGSQLRIDRIPATIIGVAPKGFVGMSDQGIPAAYVPITAYAHSRRGPGYPGIYTWSWLEMLARRKPDVTLAAAQQDLTAAFTQSWRLAAAADPGWGPVETARPRGELAPVQFERGPLAGRDSKVATWVSGVALIVLLIACANVANLFLSRALNRRREIAMRLALGVSRGRLVRQLLTESLVLSVIGGAVGLAIAQWGASALRGLFFRDGSASVLVDGRTLGFTAAATLLAALLTGVIPALNAGRGDLAATLKGGAREGHRRSRVGTGLLVFQATLSVVLLVGAGLFVRSLHNVREHRLGYDVEPVIFAAANPRGERLSDVEQTTLAERMLATAQATPGVTHAALSISVPFWSNEGRGLWVPGVDSVRKLGRFILQAGSPDYFVTMGTRILKGRAFDERDRLNAPRVAVVSEGMGRVLWPGQDPIGQCFRIGSDTVPCTTVIGVAEEMRVRSLAEAREYTYYLPVAQHDSPPDLQVFVRVRGRAPDHAEALRRRLQPLMPGAAYVNVMPLSTLVDPNLQSWRFGATMFVAFGGLALVLAAIGLYSMIAYDVAQRTRELGVRLALGSSVGRVLRLIVTGGLRLVALGVVAGTALAFWASRWMEALMFRQSARDPLVFAAVALLLLGVSVLASMVPAWRATRVDPNVVLRLD
jgi:putative ABC transport system permease protein